MRAIATFLVMTLFVSCSQSNREQVMTSMPYSSLGETLKSQYDRSNLQVEKRVKLDDKEETKVLSMDSIKWGKEISFLDEINPNRPEYVGAFVETIDPSKMQLKLKAEEKGALKQLIVEKNGEEIKRIVATIYEDKEIYSHKREVSIAFRDNLISKYLISGYQKMLFKDTIYFEIEGSIL